MILIVLPDLSYIPQINGPMEVKTFLSPMSLASLTSAHTQNVSPYSNSEMFNYPRLMAPRDLKIPTSQCNDVNFKVCCLLIVKSLFRTRFFSNNIVILLIKIINVLCKLVWKLNL